MARELRAAGVGVEVFPEPKKLGQQLQYAEAKGFTLALIAGPDEVAKGVCKLKQLATRTEATVELTNIVPAVRERLQGS
jgi:histidyl-tRNA synthetase